MKSAIKLVKPHSPPSLLKFTFLVLICTVRTTSSAPDFALSGSENLPSSRGHDHSFGAPTAPASIVGMPHFPVRSKSKTAEVTEVKHKKKPSSSNNDMSMSNLLEQNCLETEGSTTQRACFEYCTSSKYYTSGRCDSRSGQNVCVCENEKDGSNKRVKLYKPKSAPAAGRKTPQHQQTVKLVPMHEQVEFNCDNTKEAQSICQIFCATKGVTYSACALDHKSCICFRNVLGNKKTRQTLTVKRSGRQLELEEVEVEKLIGLGLVIRDGDGGPIENPTTRQLPYWSPPFQLYPQQPHHQPQGCTPYSCTRNCPRHCDNLCTQSLQCYCSCPEDTVYYDYDGPAAYPPFSFYG